MGQVENLLLARQVENQPYVDRLKTYPTGKLKAYRTRLFPLTGGAKESRSLGLHDPLDRGLATGETGLAVPLIDAVIELVVARHVARDAIGADAKRRALVLDRFVQHAEHFGVDALPLSLPQPAAGAGRMNTGTMQNFGGVEIPHAGQNLLIEKCDLDRPRAAAQSRAEIVEGDFEGVGPDFRRSAAYSEFCRREESHDAQPALVPKQNLLRGTGEFDDQPQVLAVRRVGKENETRHAGLDDDAVARVEFHEDPFAEPADLRD